MPELHKALSPLPVCRGSTQGCGNREVSCFAVLSYYAPVILMRWTTLDTFKTYLGKQRRVASRSLPQTSTPQRRLPSSTEIPTVHRPRRIQRPCGPRNRVTAHPNHEGLASQMSLTPDSNHNSTLRSPVPILGLVLARRPWFLLRLRLEHLNESKQAQILLPCRHPKMRRRHSTSGPVCSLCPPRPSGTARRTDAHGVGYRPQSRAVS